ncbi:hypothetical protein JCM21900_006122 [Sporobolomyces salmonicolor]
MRPLHGLVAIAALLQPVLADNIFYASAVSYCSAARAIEVDRFLLEYDASTDAISFDISAASVEANLDAILNFELVAYGIHAVNTSINLCEVLSGVLCPLPQYDFVGSATLPLPSSVTGKIKIPGIGYYIPDLEATAYVRLLRVTDNSEAACLRVDLSNGKTVRWASVSWALGGLALGSVALAALYFLVGTLVYPASAAAFASSSTLSPALWASLARRKERLFTLFSLLQFTAVTGLLSLNYPIIYDSYTANYAWALGLIRELPVQQSIDNLRNSTGGNLTRLAGSRNLIGGTDAMSGLFNSPAKRSLIVRDEVPAMEDVVSALMEGFTKAFSPSSSSSLGKRALSTADFQLSQLLRRADSVDSTPQASAAVVVPEVQQTDTISAVHYGIPHALVNLDMSPYNAFMTVFINFLFLMAIVVALAILGGACWALVKMAVTRKERMRRERLGLAYQQNEKMGWREGVWVGLRQRGSGPFMTVLRAGALRMLIISWFPLTLFTFYQWTIGSTDSYAPIVLSVFTIVFVGISLLVLSVRLIILARRAWPRSFPPSSSASTAIESGSAFPSTYASPFRPYPTALLATPNPNKKALPKALAREAEIVAVGELLAVGGASYSPFWNAYKCRSRRTTAGRRKQWKGRGWYFGIIERVIAPFVIALFVAFAHASGWTQSVALVVVQSLLFLGLCIWSPYEDKSSNFTHIFLAIWKVVISGALIAFNESIHLNEIARVAIGAVLAVIESILVILFFILLVIDFFSLLGFLFRGMKERRLHRNALHPDDLDVSRTLHSQMGEKSTNHLHPQSATRDFDAGGDALERPATATSSLTLNHNEAWMHGGMPSASGKVPGSVNEEPGY